MMGGQRSGPVVHKDVEVRIQLVQWRIFTPPPTPTHGGALMVLAVLVVLVLVLVLA